jgi:hypothetical protein
VNIHTARHTGLGIRVAHWEIWNSGLAILESAGFGLGMWLAIGVLASAGEQPFYVVTGGPEAPVLASVLFLIGRLWVGRDGLGKAWHPHILESLLLGIGVGLVGRAAGWGYQMVAAYVPFPDAMVLGLLRGGWRAAALVIPYAFATDRPARSRAH